MENAVNVGDEKRPRCVSLRKIAPADLQRGNSPVKSFLQTCSEEIPGENRSCRLAARKFPDKIVPADCSKELPGKIANYYVVFFLIRITVRMIITATPIVSKPYFIKPVIANVPKAQSALDRSAFPRNSRSSVELSMMK